MSHDPLKHTSSSGSDGPFVQSGGTGLLKRLFQRGGGGQDAADHAAPPAPPPAATPSRRRDTTMAPYARPRRRGERGVAWTVGAWLFRVFGWRIVVAIGALILVVIGNVAGSDGVDDSGSTLRGIPERLGALHEEGPPAAGRSGRLDVSVIAVVDGTARLSSGGTTYAWIVRDDAVATALERNAFRAVTAYWELDAADEVQVVGVQGPNASVRPNTGVLGPGDAPRAPRPAPAT